MPDGYKTIAVMLEGGVDYLVGIGAVDTTHARVFLNHGTLYLGNILVAGIPFACDPAGDCVVVGVYLVAAGCQREERT